MKSQQLETFRTFAALQRGTHGQSLIELASWVLEHGVGQLKRPERAFLYGILTRQWTVSMDDAAEIHRLYQRIGKRQEK